MSGSDVATIWISKNALDRTQVYQAKKDICSTTYFQFGSIILPRNGWSKNTIVFSGQALKEIDNKVYMGQIIEV